MNFTHFRTKIAQLNFSGGARVPPEAGTVGVLLAQVCRDNGIVRLEIFGSTARGEAVAGSDVDLIAKFTEHPIRIGCRCPWRRDIG